MISIITSTFNRAETLQRLYISLVAQTNQDFEWILVDDGSIDQTQEIMSHIISENKIKIKYHTQKNSGKHKAINWAVNMAEGELIFFVDSDDALKNNAIDYIIKKWIPIQDNDIYAGISTSCVDFKGDLVGDYNKSWTFEYIDANTFEYRYKWKVTGDKAEVFRKEILMKYPFPEFENERFLPEAVVYNRMANDGYIMRWFNEPIYICEYREDGLSSQKEKIFLSSWNGYSLYIREMISYSEVPITFKLKLFLYYILISIKYSKPFHIKNKNK